MAPPCAIRIHVCGTRRAGARPGPRGSPRRGPAGPGPRRSASETLELQRRIVRLLGRLGGHNSAMLARDGDGDGEADTVWDVSEHVAFTLPFAERKVKVHLDALLPRLCELAQFSGERQVRRFHPGPEATPSQPCTACCCACASASAAAACSASAAISAACSLPCPAP